MNNNKSIPTRKMPAEYRWFTSSCGTNLPITSTDNNNNGNIGSIDRVAALERWSLIDRPPTPEVLDEKQVANEEEVDGSLMKEEAADVAKTLLTDDKFKRYIGRSNNDNTAQSTKDTVDVTSKVESTSTTVNESPHLANGKEADTAANQTIDIDPLHQPNKAVAKSFQIVVKEAENHPIKDQPSKVANIYEPRSYHPLSSGNQVRTRRW